MQQIILECFRPENLTAAWHERRVWVPDSFQEFARFTHLTLAHFTSSTIVGAILDCGIQPRAGGAKAIEDGCHAEPGDVYLCSGVDKFYIQRAVKAHGGVGVAVVVRLPVSMLRADANILAPWGATRNERSGSTASLADRWRVWTSRSCSLGSRFIRGR